MVLVMESEEARIVRLIIADLTNRGGLSDEWHNIDEGIQNEIRDTWRTIVREVLDA